MLTRKGQEQILQNLESKPFVVLAFGILAFIYRVEKRKGFKALYSNTGLCRKQEPESTYVNIVNKTKIFTSPFTIHRLAFM